MLTSRRARWLLIAVICAYAALLVFVSYAFPFKYDSLEAVPQLYQRIGLQRAATSDIDRDKLCLPLSADCRRMDYSFPPQARIFVDGLLGKENASKNRAFFFLNYYLQPRTVSISLGEPAQYQYQFIGRSYESTNDLIRAGYDLLLVYSLTSGAILKLHPVDVHIRDDSRLLNRNRWDAFIAFLLPPLAAVLGAVIFRFLLPTLYRRISWGERHACSMALGTMIVGQTYLAARLMGMEPGPWMFGGLCILAGVVAVSNGVRCLRTLNLSDARDFVLRPSMLALLPAIPLFLAWFWLAGLDGLREYDAVVSWALRPKLFHLFAGQDLLNHFADSTLGYVHLEYPPLIPSLLALTYGAIGHVNEFVTKFWPCWMMLMLGAGILGMCGFPRRLPWLGAAIACTAIFLPLSQNYVRMEGGTVPMLFFASLGAMQLGLGIWEQQRERIALGCLMLVGASLSKFDGLLLIAAWGVVLLSTGATRRMLLPNKGFACFGLLGAILVMPYLAMLWLSPAPLNPQSRWLERLVTGPVHALQDVMPVFGALLTGQLLNEDLLRWTMPDSARLIWEGHWNGIRSLIDVPTAGYGWICIVLVLMIQRAFVATRRAVWMLTWVPLLFALGLSVVISASPQPDLQPHLLESLNFTFDTNGGRYLSPIFIAWGLGMSVLAARACAAGDERSKV